MLGEKRRRPLETYSLSHSVRSSLGEYLPGSAHRKLIKCFGMFDGDFESLFTKPPVPTLTSSAVATSAAASVSVRSASGAQRKFVSSSTPYQVTRSVWCALRDVGFRHIYTRRLSVNRARTSECCMDNSDGSGSICDQENKSTSPNDEVCSVSTQASKEHGWDQRQVPHNGAYFGTRSCPVLQGKRTETSPSVGLHQLISHSMAHNSLSTAVHCTAQPEISSIPAFLTTLPCLMTQPEYQVRHRHRHSGANKCSPDHVCQSSVQLLRSMLKLEVVGRYDDAICFSLRQSQFPCLDSIWIGVIPAQPGEDESGRRTVLFFAMNMMKMIHFGRNHTKDCPVMEIEPMHPLNRLTSTAGASLKSRAYFEHPSFLETLVNLHDLAQITVVGVLHGKELSRQAFRSFTLAYNNFIGALKLSLTLTHLMIQFDRTPEKQNAYDDLDLETRMEAGPSHFRAETDCEKDHHPTHLTGTLYNVHLEHNGHWVGPSIAHEQSHSY